MSEKTIISADPSRSFSGENAYYFDCEIIGHRPSYFVCLHKMKRREQGPLPEPHQACCAAMGNKQCTAVHMREKELLEGRSIYFVQRKRFEDMIPDRPKAPIVASKPRTLPYIPKHEMPPAPPPMPIKRQEPQMQALDFASVVTELAKETAQEAPQKPVEPPKPVAAPQPLPKAENPPKATESLLEMARRLKEARKSLTTEE